MASPALLMKAPPVVTALSDGLSPPTPRPLDLLSSTKPSRRPSLTPATATTAAASSRPTPLESKGLPAIATVATFLAASAAAMESDAALNVVWPTWRRLVSLVLPAALLLATFSRPSSRLITTRTTKRLSSSPRHPTYVPVAGMARQAMLSYHTKRLYLVAAISAAKPKSVSRHDAKDTSRPYLA